MPEQWLSWSVFTSPAWWIVPAIGAAVGSVILFFGGRVLTRRLAAGRGQPATPDALVPAAQEDRRTSHRREGSSVAVDVAHPQQPGSAGKGVVVDRSVGGLCLQVSAPIPVGTVLNLRPSTASPVVPWTQVEVRACRQEGDTWQVGCQFVRTPPYAILLLFG